MCLHLFGTEYILKLSSPSEFFHKYSTDFTFGAAKTFALWDFPRGPVIKTLTSNTEDVSLIPAIASIEILNDIKITWWHSKDFYMPFRTFLILDSL